MNCSERQDLILLYAAGELEPTEQSELRAHLETGCPKCAGALAEAQALLAQMPLALDKVQPGADVKKKLMAKIAATSPGSLSITAATSTKDWTRIVLPSAIAAILAVAVVLTAMYRMRNTLAQRDATIAQLNNLLNTAGMARVDQALQLAALEQQVANMDSMKFAKMTGSSQPQALGRVFIDLKQDKWYFFTSGMKPAAAGKTYELWLIADDKKLPAGTFNIDDKGTATLLGNVPPLPASANVKLAVTDEPAGTPQNSPTGSIQIIGDLKN